MWYIACSRLDLFFLVMSLCCTVLYRIDHDSSFIYGITQIARKEPYAIIAPASTHRAYGPSWMQLRVSLWTPLPTFVSDITALWTTRKCSARQGLEQTASAITATQALRCISSGQIRFQSLPNAIEPLTKQALRKESNFVEKCNCNNAVWVTKYRLSQRMIADGAVQSARAIACILGWKSFPFTRWSNRSMPLEQISIFRAGSRHLCCLCCLCWN